MDGTGERLPYVDEHSALIEAAPDVVWEALLRVVEGSVSSPGATRWTGMLNCEDTASGGPRPLAEGSTLPGFHVGAAEPPRELALLGAHRFSNYALTFRLDALNGKRTRLRAETRAEFPGFKGAVYRALVIGTRIHVLVTRRMLDGVRGRSEQR